MPAGVAEGYAIYEQVKNSPELQAALEPVRYSTPALVTSTHPAWWPLLDEAAAYLLALHPEYQNPPPVGPMNPRVWNARLNMSLQDFQVIMAIYNSRAYARLTAEGNRAAVLVAFILFMQRFPGVAPYEPSTQPWAGMTVGTVQNAIQQQQASATNPALPPSELFTSSSGRAATEVLVQAATQPENKGLGWLVPILLGAAAILL